jgi:hypothetical protein
MQVDGYGNIKATNNLKKRSAVSGAVQSGGGFSQILGAALADEPSVSSSIGDVAPSLPMSGLFALQEISDAEVNRKKLISRGGEILDILEKLRRSLLLGTLSPQVLRDISLKISAQRQDVNSGFNDPQLTALLDEIELRAAVELAKLEMAIDKNSIGT